MRIFYLSLLGFLLCLPLAGSFISTLDFEQPKSILVTSSDDEFDDEEGSEEEQENEEIEENA